MTLALAACAVLVLTAVSCESDGESTESGSSGQGDVPAGDDLPPPTAEEGEVPDGSGPGPIDGPPPDWFDLLKAGQLVELREVLANADDTTLPFSIDVFETLVDLREDATTVDQSQLDQLIVLNESLDSINPALGDAVTSSLTLAQDQNLIGTNVIIDRNRQIDPRLVIEP